MLITPLKSQTTASDAPAWQIAAGGKMVFEVASVKLSKAPPRPPLFPLDNGDAYLPGGRFSANFELWSYISFAYKLPQNQEQTRAALAKFPKGLGILDSFEIEARASSSTTKDQMRLMMQSLLADRFKLAVHFETREVPVLALTLVKPGKTGPQLHPHSEGPPCPEPGISPSSGDVFSVAPPKPGAPPSAAGDVFPPRCGYAAGRRSPDGMTLVGSRDSRIPFLAQTIYDNGLADREVGKPVVDQTGLEGTFDYTIKWKSCSPRPLPPGADSQPPPDAECTTFMQAVREQLGLKLVPTKGSVRMLVIDHVEAPSEN
jgi:uncharacterized protein (TIGR03435 family)